jgi:alkyl hydroperoxide reductase subunit F
MMYDLIVIGGGPAGLTATIYAIRKRLNVLMVSKDLGGKTNYHLELPWIEEYQVIRGLETVKKFRNELEYLDFAHHLDLVESVEKDGDGFVVKTNDGSSFSTKAIIVASGTRQKWLDVPGEKEYISKGLCYSALSYAPLFIDKKTVVIGDGDLALRSAAELATVAMSVVVVGTTREMMDTTLGKKLKSTSNVEILEGYQVTRVLGDEYANKVEVKSPGGDLKELKFDGAFVEKSLVSNTKFLGNLVKLDEQNRIIINCYNHTNVPGIFAAGDVTNTYAEQVLVAIGEGAKAALSVYDYLLPIL